ncbi:MAG: MCE family protein [Spirochaetales bacterium]|nr:MCE family protein [Spirochaetales bacterium]
MKFKIRFADKIVGLFIIVAIIGLLGIVFVLGANQRWFAKNWSYVARFQTAKGLTRGMGITYKGFEIGKVANVRLNSRNDVELLFYIFDEHRKKVTANSVIELASSPLGSSLVFYPGITSLVPLPENSIIPAFGSDQGQAIIALGLADRPTRSDDSISAIISNIEGITGQFNELLKSNADELDEMVKSLSATTVALNAALEGKGYGSIGTIVNELAATIQNLEKLTREVDGLIPRLLDPTGETVYPAIVKILKDVETGIQKLKEFSEFISGQAPQISGLIEKSRTTLEMGQDVLEGLKNNPLISGGISEERTQPSTLKGFRDKEF